MARVIVHLEESEHVALVTLAQRERRDPRAQAALIIRRWLEHEKLLPADSDAPTPAQPARAAESTHHADT